MGKIKRKFDIQFKIQICQAIKSGHPGSQRLPRVPASKIPGRGVACQVRLRLSGEPITDAGQAVGTGSREAQGEGRRADDDHRPSKKSRGLETPSAKRRFVDRHREQLG